MQRIIVPTETFHSEQLMPGSRRNGRCGLEHRLAARDFDEIRDVVALREHDIGHCDRTEPYTVLRDPT